MLDGALDDRQRRPQLVAGVGRELALTAQCRALLDEGLADRDEGAAGVERSETERHEDDEESARQQHVQDRVEGLDLG